MSRNPGHTVTRFDAELGHLRELVLEMGRYVVQQIEHAVEALHEESVERAREVVRRDNVVNGFDVKCDEESVRILALRQPVATDLRTVLSLNKSVADLERIGDEAKKLARVAIKLYESDAGFPNQQLLRDVTSMTNIACAMLRGALGALADLDVRKAVEVAKFDAELNSEFHAALRRLATCIMEDHRNLGHTIEVIIAVKGLERIGDHAKNIAEYVIYLVKGKDVRHISPYTLDEGREE